MSCALSCNTDSGAREPCTVATFVAVGVGGVGAGAGAGGVVAGATAAVDSGRVAVVSDVAGTLSGRTQPVAARATHRHEILMPSPPPALFCAPPRPSAPHRAGLPGRRGTSSDTSVSRALSRAP